MKPRIAMFGSSLLSSYWNGAATYYRGIIRALAADGWDITFLEPDAWDRQKHRDLEPPDWCRVHVWEASPEGLLEAAEHASQAEVVIVASGIGYEDTRLRRAVLERSRPTALKIWWDVDAPATLSEMRDAPLHPLRIDLPKFDMVLTYGGDAPVIEGYTNLGAANCTPIYNALDPDTHFPDLPDPRFAADLSFLGNRLPDREERVAEFLFRPAERLPQRGMLLGGSGWSDVALPANVKAVGHVGTADHNVFNRTPLAVLNISRESMARNGFSPATRVFEAAGAEACLITDAWEGIETFLYPGRDVLVARDGGDVVDILGSLTPEQARRIGRSARRTVLGFHTYAHRARQLGALLTRALEQGARKEMQR